MKYFLLFKKLDMLKPNALESIPKLKRIKNNLSDFKQDKSSLHSH